MSEAAVITRLFPDAILSMDTALLYYRYSERNIPRLSEYAKKLRVMQKVKTIIGVWM